MARSDVVLLTVCALCLAVAALSRWLVADVVAGVPLMTYLPGATLVAALDRDRFHVRAIERQAWIIGASLGLDGIGGLILNLAGGLTRISWLMWVAGVIIACAAVNLTLRLTPGTGSETPNGAPTTPVGTAILSAEASIGSEHPRVIGRQGLILVVAAAICVGAVMLSVHTDGTASREEFVQAWVLPRPVDDVASPSVEVGVQNRMGSKGTFIVRIVVGSGRPVTFTVPLENGKSWTHLVSRHPGEPVESTIFTSKQPKVVVDRVYLAVPDA